MTRKDAPPRTIGAARPLATGMAFGLTNPKAYPVALAIFSAIVAPYIGALHVADAPQMLAAAFIGFLLADAVLIFMAGLPAVRRFFLTHGAVTTGKVARSAGWGVGRYAGSESVWAPTPERALGDP